MTTPITLEHASRRFFQVATIERAIVEKLHEIATCADHLKDLRKEYDGLIHSLRAAARDEGELPLFDHVLVLLEGDDIEHTPPLEGTPPAIEETAPGLEDERDVIGRWRADVELGDRLIR